MIFIAYFDERKIVKIAQKKSCSAPSVTAGTQSLCVIKKKKKTNMLKLYKKINNELHFWETWDKSEKIGIIHWGKVGEEGKDREVKSIGEINFRNEIQKEIDEKLNEGYAQIEMENHRILLIEYKVEGMGNTEDLNKRSKLQERMDQTLGWVGIGHCDGGSMGSGTMEVCCFVVDFEIAKKVIEEDLFDTEFEDFERIYDENE